MIPSRDRPFDPTRRGPGGLPRTAAESRQFDEWLSDISRRPLTLPGVDVVFDDDGTVGVGDFARSTLAWSVGLGLPVQYGAVLRMAWSDDTRLLLFVPRAPSLLPADGIWLPYEAVERDDLRVVTDG